MRETARTAWRMLPIVETVNSARHERELGVAGIKGVWRFDWFVETVFEGYRLMLAVRDVLLER